MLCENMCQYCVEYALPEDVCQFVCTGLQEKQGRSRAGTTLDDHHRKYIRACLCVSVCLCVYVRSLAGDARSNTKKHVGFVLCVLTASFWGMGPAYIDEFWAILLGSALGVCCLSVRSVCVYVCCVRPVCFCVCPGGALIALIPTTTTPSTTTTSKIH